MRNYPKPSGHTVVAASSRGFTLVEVTLALGIAVFCLVVVFGLLNVGINTSSASIEQTAATDILSAVAGDLRTAPNTFPKGSQNVATAIYGLTIPAHLAVGATAQAPGQQPASYLASSGQPLGSGAVPPNGARYQLDCWTKAGVGRDVTQVRIMISWPPKASVPAGSVESLIFLDRN